MYSYKYVYRFVQYETDNLDQCSPYTLQIQPLYADQQLAPKIVEFRFVRIILLKK